MQDKFYVLRAYALTGLVIALWLILLWAKEKGVGGTQSPIFRSMQSTTAWLWKAVGYAIAANGVKIITGESVTSPLIKVSGLIALATSMSGRKFNVVAMLTSFLVF